MAEQNARNKPRLEHIFGRWERAVNPREELTYLFLSEQTNSIDIISPV